MTEPVREDSPESGSSKRALLSMVVITVSCVLAFGAWRFAAEHSAPPQNKPRPAPEQPSASEATPTRGPDIILGPPSSETAASSADAESLDDDESAGDARTTSDARGASIGAYDGASIADAH